jgi:hypothetical protein
LLRDLSDIQTKLQIINGVLRRLKAVRGWQRKSSREEALIPA